MNNSVVTCQKSNSYDKRQQKNAAEDYITNLGRTVLSKADLIVLGTISQNQGRHGTLSTRDLVIQETLWGSLDKIDEITLFFSDSTSFTADDSTVLVALTPIKGSDTRFNLFGKRMPAKDQVAVDAVKDYIALEQSAGETVGRLDDFHTLLSRHLAAGGAAAKLASVELIYIVKNHPNTITHERYLEYAKLHDAMDDKQTQKDVTLALKGMVLNTLKAEAQVGLMRAKDDDERLPLMAKLEHYFKDLPAAFNNEDAARCDAIGSGAGQSILDALSKLKTRIEDDVRSRENPDTKLSGDEQGKTDDADKTEEQLPESPFVAPPAK